jgi:hypothetical protein
MEQGILGWFDPSTVPEQISIVTGWNWYTGVSPTQVGASQYDFETAVIHELGHALGLEHSHNPASAMFATLAPGVAHRMITVGDLNLPANGLGIVGLQISNLPKPPQNVSDSDSLAVSMLVETEQGMWDSLLGHLMTKKLPRTSFLPAANRSANSIDNGPTDAAHAHEWRNNLAAAHKMYDRQLLALDAVFTDLGRKGEDGVSL